MLLLLNKVSRSGISASALAYINLVLGVRTASLLAYWPFNEKSGSIVDNAQGVSARDGLYSGISLNASTGPFGGPAGRWALGGDHADMQTASLASVINTAEGSVSVWAKVATAGIWTDATQRRVFYFAVDGSNFVTITRPTVNNRLDGIYRAGGTQELISKTSYNPTGWMHLVITWSASNDRVRFYVDGTQVGADATGLGTWAGSVSSFYAGSQTPSTNAWNGFISNLVIWSAELTSAEVITLYNGGPTS